MLGEFKLVIHFVDEKKKDINITTDSAIKIGDKLHWLQWTDEHSDSPGCENGYWKWHEMPLSKIKSYEYTMR